MSVRSHILPPVGVTFVASDDTSTIRDGAFCVVERRCRYSTPQRVDTLQTWFRVPL